MTSRMTCDRFTDELPTFLENEADEPTRVAIEAHADDCRDCGSLLADLRRLAIDAASLPELTPSRDLWAGISERIDTPVIAIDEGRAATRGRTSPALWTWLGAAAIVVATAGITHMATRRALAPAKGSPPVASAPVVTHATADAPTVVATDVAQTEPAPVVESKPLAAGEGQTALVANRKLSTEEVYGREIARLRAVVQRRSARLDPATVSVLERNLRIIDEAIAQSKRALEQDPASHFLMQSLNEALESKVELLRTAAALPFRS